MSGVSVYASTAPSLEVGEVRSLGSSVSVPVTIRNTTYLTSGSVEITLPSTSPGVALQKFEPTNLFNGDLFRTESNLSGGKLRIDFISQTGSEQRLTGKTVVGYITYGLTKDFYPGMITELTIDSLVAKGRYGADFTLEPLHGKIERKMPIGDVVGQNKPNALAATRIIQHINGNPIAEREAFLSADVDGDGVLTQNDALQILDFVSGKRDSFLAIAAQELDPAVLKSEYSVQVEALHGREPYVFKRQSGTIPSGLTLNASTGELSGTPSRAGNYTFSLQVTDAIGNTATRQFTLDVIDSNIIAVEKLFPINVKLNEVPTLPNKVMVTYKDKTTGMEPVVWGPVDTSVIGKTVAKGKIGDSGFTVSVAIEVVSINYVYNIAVNYFEFLNLHTVVIDVSPEVYDVTINGLPTHYEGNDRFSLGSSRFTKGSSVTIRLYDKYGNLLETKQHPLVVR